MDFADQVVLITGSSSSIGFATASVFLEAGARVMINGSGQGRLDSALQRMDRFGDRVDGHRADVRDSQEATGLVEATVKRFGALDVLVNCAGVTTSFPVLDLPEEEWDRAMDVNLKGPFLVSKAAARVMLAQGRGGRIVNIASKAGLIQFTKALAMELGRHGITVNAVAPGVVVAKDKAKPAGPRVPGELLQVGPSRPRRRSLGRRRGGSESLCQKPAQDSTVSSSWATRILTIIAVG